MHAFGVFLSPWSVRRKHRDFDFLSGSKTHDLHDLGCASNVQSLIFAQEWPGGRGVSDGLCLSSSLAAI